MNRDEAKEPRDRLMEELVKRRKQLKLSQQQVAQRMGTVQSHVCEMESGYRDVTVTTLLRYADAVQLQINLTTDYLD